MKNRIELVELANYVKGYADATDNNRLREVGEQLEMLSRHVCGQGFICNGGNSCCSDHK